MRYFALATDYDGTLAEDGTVSPNTLSSLKRLRTSGRRLVLVTGRELPDLKSVFPEYEVFDLIVAENGAILYEPSSNTETALAPAPPDQFAKTLSGKGIWPLHQGQVIIATLEDRKELVLDTIRELGLELQIIFNKGSLMVLPTGVNKATGLAAALEKLSLSPHNTVAVGDAENDHALLRACERSVAVINALPALKDAADFVTTRPAGAGVSELIEHLIQNDLMHIPAKDQRDMILLGDADGREISTPSYGTRLLVAGTSGGGKSTLTNGIMERLQDAGYQFVVIDPEGDYQNFEDALVLGDIKRIPASAEILNVLDNPTQSLIVNLLGVHADDRPIFFESLWAHLQEVRARTGRPHWIILDEAHHLVPENRNKSQDVLQGELIGTMFVTIEPDHVAEGVLALIDTIVAVGETPRDAIEKFSSAHGLQPPNLAERRLERGQAVLWSTKDSGEPLVFQVHKSRTDQVRHSRKYAGADLTPDRSFYFRGPEGKLKLRAQNVITFIQLLEGVDDETWMHHLRAGDYSKWFRENIKDKELADAVADVEKRKLMASESRAQIKELIEQRFTLPT